jgi:hypothetical protein
MMGGSTRWIRNAVRLRPGGGSVDLLASMPTAKNLGSVVIKENLRRGRSRQV